MPVSAVIFRRTLKSPHVIFSPTTSRRASKSPHIILFLDFVISRTPRFWFFRKHYILQGPKSREEFAVDETKAAAAQPPLKHPSPEARAVKYRLDRTAEAIKLTA